MESNPSQSPTATDTVTPTREPSLLASANPSAVSSTEPSLRPSARPSPSPTRFPTTKPVMPSTLPSMTPIVGSISAPTTSTVFPSIEPPEPETRPSNYPYPSLTPSYLPTDPINIDDILSQVAGYEQVEKREIDMFQGLAILGGFIVIIAVITLLLRKTFCHEDFVIPSSKNPFSWSSSSDDDESSCSSGSNSASYNVQDYIDLVEGQDFVVSTAESSYGASYSSSDARAPVSTIHVKDPSAKDGSYRGSKAGSTRKSKIQTLLQSMDSKDRERSLKSKRSSSLKKSRSGSGLSVGSLRSHSSHRSRSSHRSSSSHRSTRSSKNKSARRRWISEAHPSSLSHEISSDIDSIDTRDTERITNERSTCCGL
uniref:Uncharacterized protein n=1 Tax=Leptocylindrus danicus TaxID=163516 RepID=A0A7S2PRM2_9STRA